MFHQPNPTFPYHQRSGSKSIKVYIDSRSPYRDGPFFVTGWTPLVLFMFVDRVSVSTDRCPLMEFQKNDARTQEGSKIFIVREQSGFIEFIFEKMYPLVSRVRKV